MSFRIVEEEQLALCLPGQWLVRETPKDSWFHTAMQKTITWSLLYIGIPQDSFSNIMNQRSRTGRNNECRKYSWRWLRRDAANPVYVGEDMRRWGRQWRFRILKKCTCTALTLPISNLTCFQSFEQFKKKMILSREYLQRKIGAECRAQRLAQKKIRRCGDCRNSATDGGGTKLWKPSEGGGLGQWKPEDMWRYLCLIFASSGWKRSI